jgi:5'-phosphate synthase pdxT subunit
MVATAIGVLAIQGAVSEHIAMMKQTFEHQQIAGKVIVVRTKDDIKQVDGLIIPGGESTTISKVMKQTGMFEVISKRIEEHTLGIMGTCAGCVLLANEVVQNDHEIDLLQAMDIQVQRNAFGRQKESFEQDIMFNDFSTFYHGVFIRAPSIVKTWGNCRVLAQIEKKIIAARQQCFLALSFHPELSRDIRIHSYFLDMFI